MKKIIFWSILFWGLVLCFKIGRIFIMDIHRLTKYGDGYLTGLIILFIAVISSAVILGIKIHKKNHLS
jgi:hypothetical protein